VETVVVAHGSDVGELERMPTWLRRRVVHALQRPRISVRAVSQDLSLRLQTLAAEHAADARHTLSIAVEPAVIEIPALAPRDQLRRELGLPAGPVVVVVGRVVQDKRIDVAVLATLGAVERAHLPDATTILVIGDGPERERLRQRFPTVGWLGQIGREQALRYIRAADLLVSASEREGAPTVVREARALGTAVVAAEAGDLRNRAADDPELYVVEHFSAAPDGRAATIIAERLRCRARKHAEP